MRWTRTAGSLLRRFLRDEQGTEVLEWSVIAGLIVGALVVVLSSISAWAVNRFTTLQSDLAS